MARQNYRYDEFTGEDESVLITGEAITVPASGKPYVSLAELPREDSPSTITVTSGGSSSTLSPTEDTYIYEGSPSTNYAASLFMAAGKDDAGVYHSYLYRGLMKFDLSGLPSTISTAKLRLYRELGHSNPTFEIHRVTSTWAAGSVTWGTRPGFDLIPAASVNANSQPAWFEFDVTELVQGWLSGTYANYGLQLTSNEVDSDTVSNWTSLEGGANAPVLFVAGAGDLQVELPYNVAPAAGEFAVHYGTGRLRFPASAAGNSYTVDYFGTGGAIDMAD